MKTSKLEELRQRFGGDEDDIRDPSFRKVADYQYTSKDKRRLPYDGWATLLDAPPTSALDGLDVALIGVPMDLGVTNRSGARFGPRALRSIERIGPYNHALDVVPFSTLRCGDVGDVQFRSRYDLDMSIADIEAYYHQVIDAGVIPLSVGVTIRSRTRS